MAGSSRDYGRTYTEVFGTVTPVTGPAPTGSLDGQALNGLTGLTVVVSAPASSVLVHSGSLQCYIYDSSLLAPNAYALMQGGSWGTGSISYVQSGSSQFQIGMIVTSQSGAVGTITSASYGTVGSGTLFLSPTVGSASFGERLTGVDQPRWARSPNADFTVTADLRDQAFAPVTVVTPRFSRIKWVPNGVGFTSGSGGVTVSQLGQSPVGTYIKNG